MHVRKLAFCLMSLALLGIYESKAAAPTVPAPTTYTVTTINGIFGDPQQMTVYRSGSKALIDLVKAADASDPKASHVRSLYNLDKHTNISWNWPDSSAGCGASSFSGDWGDPFAGAAEVTDKTSKQVGTETLHGMPANIMLTVTPQATVKAWIDTKYGMILKADMSAPGTPAKTIIEVKSISLAAPAASTFTFPANCAGVEAAPPPPTEAEKIAALTGDDPQNYVNANYGPGSKAGCSMVFRVVKAKTMEPVTSGFQIAVDLNIATEPTPHYVMGVSDNVGGATWQGGAVKEVTAQMRNGVLRMDHIPAQFSLFYAFPRASSGDSLIYRQCFAPQTVLLFVIKNPANLSEGSEYLWVKSGKYATPPR